MGWSAFAQTPPHGLTNFFSRTFRGISRKLLKINKTVVRLATRCDPVGGRVTNSSGSWGHAHPFHNPGVRPIRSLGFCNVLRLISGQATAHHSSSLLLTGVPANYEHLRSRFTSKLGIPITPYRVPNPKNRASTIGYVSKHSNFLTTRTHAAATAQLRNGRVEVNRGGRDGTKRERRHEQAQLRDTRKLPRQTVSVLIRLAIDQRFKSDFRHQRHFIFSRFT